MTPVAGIVPQHAAMRLAAAGVPSQTMTMPACCE
jgi:hypothetical protein